MTKELEELKAMITAQAAHILAQEERLKALEEMKGPPPDLRKQNSTDIRALLVIDKLKDTPPRNGGLIYLNSAEILHFLQYEIKEEFRIISKVNPWKAVSDVMKKAEEKRGPSVYIHESRIGRKRKSLIFDPAK